MCVCLCVCVLGDGLSGPQESQHSFTTPNLSLTSFLSSNGRRKWKPLQDSCLENPHGQRSLAGYSPWGRKESDTTKHEREMGV